MAKPFWLLLAFIASCARPSTAFYHCSSDDYAAVFSPCVDGQRSRTYHWKSPKVCDCTSSSCLPEPDYNITCACVHGDLYADTEQCDSTSEEALASWMVQPQARCDRTSLTIPDPVPVACECTDRDVITEYTECDPITHTRSQVNYYNRSCTQHSGHALDPPTHGLPCTEVCGAGMYLRNGCEQCPAGTFALDGTTVLDDWSALSTHENRNQIFHFGPVELSTSCIQEFWGSSSYCNGWIRAGDGSLQSGLNSRSRDSRSILKLSFTLVRPGKLTFTYSVDAELGWDGLTVSTQNGAGAWNSLHFKPAPGISLDDSRLLASYADRQEQEIVLAKGHNTIQFTYRKGYFFSVGADRAAILDIRIEGTSFSAEECTPCPPGTHSAPGAATCNRCGTNQVGGADGSCVGCPPDEYALFSSTECSPKSECTDHDHFEHQSQCIAGNRTSSFDWFEPKVCGISCESRLSDIIQLCEENETYSGNCSTTPAILHDKCQLGPCCTEVVENPEGFFTCSGSGATKSEWWLAQVPHPDLSNFSETPTPVTSSECPASAFSAVSLPPKITSACADSCPAGSFHNSSAQQCQPCPLGEFNPTPGGSCAKCSPNSIPYRFLSMSSFQTWPNTSNFSIAPSLCHGSECLQGTGFRLTGESIDSGLDTGPELYSELEIKIEVLSPAGGVLAIQTKTNSAWDCHNTAFQIERNDLVLQSVGSCDGTATANLRQGSNVVRLKAGAQTTETALLIIKNISLEGTVNGGGVRCDGCSVGTIANLTSASCQACPPGFFHGAVSQADECQACPVGTAASVEGSGSCFTCPAGFKSSDNTGSPHCVCDGLIVTPPNSSLLYNLTGLNKSLSQPSSRFNIEGDHSLVTNLNTIRLSLCSANGTSATLYRATSTQVGEETSRVFATSATTIGRDLSFTELSRRQGGPAALVLNFGSGDRGLADTDAEYPCFSNESVYSLQATVHCQQSDLSEMVRYNNQTCVFHLSLTNPSACPLCTLEMVVQETTACTDGHKVSTYRKVRECAITQKNIQFSAVTVESCSTTEVSHTALILGVTIPAIVVVLVGGFAFKKWYAYRKLYNQYNNLAASVPTAEEFGSLEMDEADPCGGDPESGKRDYLS